MSNNTPTEIVNPEDRSHSVSVDGLPNAALRAIIGKLNERSQAATRTFNEHYDLGVTDIKQILDKIHQEFNGRKIINMSATVSLFLSKGQRHDFRTWDEFSTFDTASKEKTRSISLEVVIDVLDGNDGSPERYQCQVSIQNNPSRFGFVIGPVAFSPIDSAGLPPTPIAATVKYNNYIVGKNLLASIDDWEATLKRREISFLQKLKTWSSSIRQALTFLGSIAGLISSYRVLPYFISEDDWQKWAVSCILITAIFWQIASIAGKLVERYIDRRKEAANIVVTVGDQRDEDAQSKKNTTYARKAVASAGVVVFQIAIAVVASPIIGAIWN